MASKKKLRKRIDRCYAAATEVRQMLATERGEVRRLRMDNATLNERLDAATLELRDRRAAAKYLRELREIAVRLAPEPDGFIPEVLTTSRGAVAIAQERSRQIIEEGYDAEHDAAKGTQMLTFAALAYAHHAVGHGIAHSSEQWPWSPEDFKPGTRRRDLEKAGALIAAAIDRLPEGE